MREILFRGKRTDNGAWVEGYLYVTHNGECEIGRYNAELNIERFTHIVRPDTIGQYTGLTANGKKIFEGDIVRYKIAHRFSEDEGLEAAEKFYLRVDTVGYGGGGFYPLPHRVDCEDYWYSYGFFDFEVIGNIHDNPELLKGE